MTSEPAILPLTSSAFAAASAAAIRFGVDARHRRAACARGSPARRRRPAAREGHAGRRQHLAPRAAARRQHDLMAGAQSPSLTSCTVSRLRRRIAILHELQDRRRRFLHRAARDVDDRPAVLRAQLARVGDLGGDAVAVDVVVEVAVGQHHGAMAAHLGDAIGAGDRGRRRTPCAAWSAARAAAATARAARWPSCIRAGRDRCWSASSTCARCRAR